MPHLRVRGASAEDVAALSRMTTNDLTQAFNCQAEDITWELCSTQFFVDGRVSSGYPVIECVWFDRGLETKQTVARALDNALQQRGYSGDRAVIFNPIDNTNYFECGQHF